nr:uncharacterized protein LOC112490965 isoform X8 [Ziziphus jujuba var. spinosa]
MSLVYKIFLDSTSAYILTNENKFQLLFWLSQFDYLFWRCIDFYVFLSSLTLICSASDHAMETKFRGGYLTFTMQFQRSDSGCNTWWIFIWPSSSARICDCSIFQPNGHNQDTAGEKLMLAVSKDHIQVGMAANLRDIVLTDYEGRRYTIIPENKVGCS